MTVCDDGALSIPVYRAGSPGSGLSSIRERTAELGGVCEIRHDRAGGQVSVRLPVVLWPGHDAPEPFDKLRTGSVEGRKAGSVEGRISMTVRIVLADDHAVVREGLRALLSTVADYVVVGEASTGAEAVRAAVTERPDVLVMDIQMPGQNGIEATREIGRAAPEIAVLMLTMFDDDESLFAAMRAGAFGYVLKGAAPDSIIRAITAVAAGEAIFAPGWRRGPCATCIGPRRTWRFPS